MTNNDKQKKHSNSSKIKTIRIGLFNYRFFHGPSAIGNVDNHFIGREDLIRRFKMILTANETKSGAYLVSGYRGMGKTSFVNKVISEINNESKHSMLFFRNIQIAMLVFLTIFINHAFLKMKLIWLPTLIIPFIIMLILINKLTEQIQKSKTEKPKHDKSKLKITPAIIYKYLIGLVSNSLSNIIILLQLGNEKVYQQNVDKNKKNPKLWSKIVMFLIICFSGITLFLLFRHSSLLFVQRYTFLLLVMIIVLYMIHRILKNRLIESLARILVFREHLSNKRSKNLLQAVVKALVIALLTITLCSLFDNNQLIVQFFVALLIQSIIMLTAQYIVFCKSKKNKVDGNDKKDIFLTELFKSVLRRFSNLFSKRNYCIHVNLSYDNLKEIDIFKQIAYSLENQFTSHHNFSVYRMIEQILIFIFIYLITWQSVNILNYHKISDEVKKVTCYTEYFPSQDSLVRRDSFPIKRLKDEIAGRTLITTDDYNHSKHSSITITNNLDSSNTLITISEQAESASYLIFKNKVGLYIAYLTRYTDFLVFTFSYKLEQLVKELPIISFVIPKSIFAVPGLNYLFWLHFTFSYLIFVFVKAMFFRKRNGYHSITKRIKELNDLIDYSISCEQGITVGTTNRFNFFNKQTKAHNSICDVREIEAKLEKIFESFENHSPLSLMPKPQFICILDELDKIEPHDNVLDKEDEQAKSRQSDNSFFSTESARLRQHAILKILSNLKKFITTTNCKFIFIAGREMYDMALADVSDRNFYINTIFNDIFYIESFLKDTGRTKKGDIRSRTEEYVCKYLMPLSFNTPKECNLKSYNKYLESLFDKNGISPEDKQIIDKILVTVSNFITYITYRCNGAPKKLTNYFELYIAPVDPCKKYSNTDEIILPNDEGGLYLEFKETKQYEINMISFLVNPIINVVNQSIETYSDKLLISTSFLVDHLFKFHSFAFSWRNIEQIPELIDINKAPELRQVIKGFMDKLSNNHIDEIYSGLFGFRFNKKVSEELSYLSKVSDMESAALNFTLDESLTLKRHFKRIIRDVRNNSPENNMQHDVSFVHMILGDLYFYDEEYNEAILEYMAALKQMRYKIYGSNKEDDASNFIIYIRNMLKMGLAFEKRQSYSSAYMLYGMLTSKIIGFRDINLDDLGLEERRANNENVFVRKYSDKSNKYNTEIELEECFEKYPEHNDFNKILHETNFTPLKAKLLYKVSSFENIRILYQPIIAKLQIIEKSSSTAGITLSDVQRTVNELKYIYKIIHPAEHYLLEAEMYNKIGDVLYYKNLCNYELTGGKNIQSKPYCIKVKRKIKTIVANPSFIATGKNGNPCVSCNYYFKSLEIYCEKLLGLSQSQTDCCTKYIYNIYNELCSKKIKTNHVNNLTMFANVIGGLGNTFLSCCGCAENLLITSNDIETLCYYLKKNDDENRPTTLQKVTSKIQETFLLYTLAYRAYKIAGSHKNAAIQLYKIVSVLNFLCKKDETNAEVIGGKFKEIEEQIVNRYIRNVYRIYENNPRIEIENYKNIKDKGMLNDSFFDLKHISVTSEIYNMLIMFEEIELICKKRASTNVRFAANPYQSVSNMYVRISQLRHKIRKNEFYEIEEKERIIIANYQRSRKSRHTRSFNISNIISLCKIRKEEIFINRNNKTNLLAFKKNIDLILDNIYCASEIQKIINTYGISYRIGYYILGGAHRLLGENCEKFINGINLIADQTRQSELKNKFRDICGEDILNYSSTRFHFEKSREAYFKLKELHCQGDTYKTMLNNMYYFNDDFGDAHYHFQAGMDRLLINSGKIDERIKICDNKTDSSTIYKYEKY